MHNFEYVEDIMNQEQRCVDGGRNKKVSCRQYYCYKLQIRNDQSILLHSTHLLRQYIVNMYIKLEITILDYYKKQK